VGRQVVLAGFVGQTVADNSVTLEVPTGLLDTNDHVLRVISFEFQFTPNIVMTWTNPADCSAIAVLGNKAKGLGIGLQHRSVVKSFAISLCGVVAGTTEVSVPVDFVFTPNYNIYLYNELAILTFGSFATGVINTGTYRIVCEEVTVSMIDKVQMKGLV
jgi:hypothetical protein